MLQSMRVVPADEGVPFTKPTIKRHRIEGGRGEIYPYDEWADGNLREALQGEDFTCHPHSFRAALHRWARRNGDVRLSTRVDNGRVFFQLGPLTPEQAAERRFYVTPGELPRPSR